jgi:predicted GTPase
MIFALGRGLSYYDMPAVRTIVRESARQDYRFSSLIMGIVKSTPFQKRIVAADEARNTPVKTAAQ